ncbi:MAG TPA: CpsD/CapB family tyrosine-protein kinase [Phycisphaerae bacterium]|nr:CpsD/CapB family tyrosine-protein kinase [Phycisphaerae bacterium]
MGRIAEALKRAQEDRQRRLEGESADRATGSRPGSGEPSVVDEGLLCGTIIKPPQLRRPFTTTTQPIPAEAVDPRVLAFHDPICQIAEKYRSVRTRLLTNNPGGSARVHAIASTLRQEGRTITAANLGFSLAELRHLRVAIIDLDVRQGGLTRLFQAEGRPGMIEVLRGEKRLAEACIPVVRDNLHLVPVGRISDANPSELLAGGVAAGVFREINERYHYALVDTPPIHTCADIGLIGPLCHSVLIVARMNHTPESLLRRSVKMLQANHISVAGCILVGGNEDTIDRTGNQDFYTGAPQ